MIKNTEAISMVEALGYAGTKEGEGAEIKKFVKKFTKMTPTKAKELKEKLEEMDLMKVKDRHIVKVIDILPENQEELNKIFVDVGLDEDETKKILDTVKEYK